MNKNRVAITNSSVWKAEWQRQTARHRSQQVWKPADRVVLVPSVWRWEGSLMLSQFRRLEVSSPVCCSSWPCTCSQALPDLPSFLSPSLSTWPTSSSCLLVTICWLQKWTKCSTPPCVFAINNWSQVFFLLGSAFSGQNNAARVMDVPICA